MTLTTIWIQPGYGGREALTAMNVGMSIGFDVRVGGSKPRSEFAPIGDVPFCESLLPFRPKPCFYPSWLSSWFHREILLGVDPYGFSGQGQWFIKSSSGYKDYPARIWDTATTPTDGLVDISEIVKFVQEWRYYVTDGRVVATGWYDGIDEAEPAPELSIDWPTGWNGAADFGRLDTGEIALVECHHPYACGWYGDDGKAFIQWIVDGWKYMTFIPASK